MENKTYNKAKNDGKDLFSEAELHRMNSIFYQMAEMGSLGLDAVPVWSCRRLHPILGYRRWKDFKHVIRKATELISGQGIDTRELIFKKYTQGEKRVKGKKEDMLVRDHIIQRGFLDALLQFSQADPEASRFVKLYLETQDLREEHEFERLQHRTRINGYQSMKAEESRFESIMKGLGLSAEDVDHVFLEGERAFWGGMSPDEVHKILNIPAGKSIYDFLPESEIASRDVALCYACEKTEKEGIKDKKEIIYWYKKACQLWHHQAYEDTQTYLQQCKQLLGEDITTLALPDPDIRESVHSGEAEDLW